MRKTLSELLEDEDFRRFWADTDRGMYAFRFEEAVLDYIYRPKQRIGNASELNLQAGIDMWRLEGAMELWEKLTGLLYENVSKEEIDDDSSGI